MEDKNILKYHIWALHRLDNKKHEELNIYSKLV